LARRVVACFAAGSQRLGRWLHIATTLHDDDDDADYPQAGEIEDFEPETVFRLLAQLQRRRDE
jgi:hypothetical protein